MSFGMLLTGMLLAAADGAQSSYLVNFKKDSVTCYKAADGEDKLSLMNKKTLKAACVADENCKTKAAQILKPSYFKVIAKQGERVQVNIKNTGICWFLKNEVTLLTVAKSDSTEGGPDECQGQSQGALGAGPKQC